MSKVLKSLTFIFLIAATTLSSVGQTTYQERCDSVKAFFSTFDIASDYFILTARFHEGVDLDTAMSTLDDLLSSQPRGDAYWMFSTMTLYLHGSANLPERQKKRIRELWKTYQPLPGRSEHEQVLYYAALLLASENFDDMEQRGWFNGKSTDQNHAEAEAFLLDWFARTTEDGMEEFDSPTHTGFFLSAMLLLRDFASDRDMRTRAEIMLDWLLAEFAAKYRDGMYTGPHSLEFEYSAIRPRASAMTCIGALLFGDVELCYSGEQLLFAFSSYRPPDILRQIALEYVRPYTIVQKRRTGVRYRNTTAPKYVYETTFLTPWYSLGSLNGGLIQPVNQHSWDASWKAPIDRSTIFSMHPAASPELLAEFYPACEEEAWNTLASLYGRYPTFNKYVGGSPYEELFQHRNTLIAMYDIPKTDRHQLITTFFPHGLDATDADSTGPGWILARSGRFFIGVFAVRPYQMVSEPAGTRFVSPFRRNALIVQVASPPQVPTFEDFIKRVKSSKVDTSAFARKKRIRYTTIFGDKLEFTYGGARKVNRKKVRFDPDYLVKSPVLNSKAGSGILRVTFRKDTLILNMKNVRITHQP